MAISMLPLNCLHVALIFLLLSDGDCFQAEQNPCDLTCPGFLTPDLPYQRGVRYAYRYSTAISTAFPGSGAGRNGLAFDCVVDIEVVSKCHLTLQIRNPQVKRLSHQKEHSVQRLKKLRESLERARLKFSLQGGKVTALCPQEGEQVWALNMKRALLSMFQTSRMASKQELVRETDVYGTCTSRYERRGPVLLKTRDLTECHQSRLANFWPHSVSVTEDTSVQSELHCVQKHESTLMQEVNCTEAVSMTTWSETARVTRTQTVSSLVLLRAQPVTPPSQDSAGSGVPTDLQFEDERVARPRRDRASTLQDISQAVRKLCSLTSDPKTISHEFLQLVFQLRDLSRPRLRTLWEDASFKCRNDWQPLLEALPACGSEGCIALLSDLMRNKELEEQQAHAFLSTVALIPHPTPQMIHSINNVLLEVPEVHSKALLSGSSLVYQLCQRSHGSCGELPQVQTFINRLEEILKGGTKTETPTQGQTLFYALKSVGNLGLSAPVFVPLLNHFMLSRSSPLELRLAATHALRRYPCSVDRAVLLQLYRSSQEDPEVRIAAYQQLMRCPNQDLFEAVKMTLKSETSSQVGSYVWSHLTNLLRSEDPMKQTLIESLPEDIISRDFESEFLKYSSYADYTVSSGMGITNVETSLVFSPKSFLPRSAAANLTVYFHGRAHNLLEVEVHVENAEPLLRNFFGHGQHESDAESVESKEVRGGRRTEDGHKEGQDGCLNGANRVLDRAKAVLFGRRRTETSRPKCWMSVKVFGNELSVFTCDDLYQGVDQLPLSMAGLAVKLLKGQEVQLSHRAVLMTEELLLPSLSGLPVRLGVNMTSFFSLRLKGIVNYRDTSHFSLSGYIKPNAHVELSARMGVDSALGHAAMEWVSELRSSTSLDGSVQLQEGQDLRAMLNTPEDAMDIISLSSRVFQLSGDLREEIRGPKTRVQKTTCTPKTWSKMVGWQLCSNASYPFPAEVFLLPPPGPVSVSLRLLKLDRGLHYYLLEAAYSLLTQGGSWLPREASLHLLLATPQSSVLRDMSLDVNFSPQRLLLRITHPLKSILIQGQLLQDRRIKSGKLELLIDGVHSYILGLVDTQDLQSEQHTRYHVEAKMAPGENPMILSANVTRNLGRKTSFAATVKNVFSEAASLSAVLERRRDGSTKQYSMETELLLPGILGTRVLGLMEQRGSVWNSALRLKYGLGGNARSLLQECYTSQRMRSERDANFTNVMRADHEFYCSSTAPVNHKIHLRHEESHSHVKSTLDVSYGKHWDEINNKRTLLLSQFFRNQSTPTHTSYTLEFNLQVPEKNLNYRTQLLHSHLRQPGSESSTHLKINYNELMPLVAGIHWKSPSEHSLQKKWEGMFNLDMPWLHVYTAHKLSQLQRRTFRLTSELAVSKWLSIRNLHLEAFLMDGGGEKEARLKLYTPAVTYVRAAGWGVAEKQNVKASASIVTLWTPLLRGNLSLENSKRSHALHVTSTYGKHNLSLSAALNTVDKVLLKRQVMLKVTHQRPKSPPAEMELEGVMEVLRRDNKMHQQSAMIQLRQPFQILPHTLLLRETFTVDLPNGLYTLESKARFHSNGDMVHVLTLGYRPPSPFVCSTLIHPFSSDTVPSDSEICLNFTSDQTDAEVRGTIHFSKKEMLHLFAQVHADSWHPGQHEFKVGGNLSHRFTLQLPSFAAAEADVRWSPKNNSRFDYQAKGKLRVERQECRLSVQLSGSPGNVGLYSSLKHPFKSRVPKLLEVKANVSAVAGQASSSMQMRADGKDRAKLDASMFHFLQRGSSSVGLTVNVSQRLLPSTSDLRLSAAANTSSENVSLHGFFQHGHESLLAQARGSLKSGHGLQLAVSAELRNSIANFALLPSVLGLDAALQQSDMLTQDSSDSGRKVNASTRLCAWSGSEQACVNVSRKLGDRETGEVHARLLHSSRLLNGTGVPADSSVNLRWARGVAQLSLLAEVLAGGEHLRAEFNGGKADQETPQWEYLLKLSHQAKALLKRGISNSIQARTRYQLQAEGLEASLTLHAEDRKMVDGLLRVGSKNGTATLGVSLWQQLGLLPEVLQMNCTGDAAAADRLSAHCCGNLAGHPLEVRVFRSYRPHSRRCYGAALTHSSLNAQAKGCHTSSGQRELRANFTHSGLPVLARLGIPSKWGLRLLLRPGPQRWGLGAGLLVGSWVADLNLGLRMERPGVYGWHGFLMSGTRSSSHKAEITGRIRLESWCNIWADAAVVLNSVSLTLLASARCKGAGRLEWSYYGSDEAGQQQKTSLTVRGQRGANGLKSSLGFENGFDSLRIILSALLKGPKANFGCALQHHWASVASFIPNRLDLQGSALLRRASVSGSVRVSVDTRLARVDVAAAWDPSAALRVALQQNLTTSSAPEGLAVNPSNTDSQTLLEAECSMCRLRILTARRGTRADGTTAWNFVARQQRASLKALLPSQASANISIARSGCSTHLSAVLQAEGQQRGELHLRVSCQPSLNLEASVRHSMDAIMKLGFPPNGGIILKALPAHRPGVEASVELGPCHFHGICGLLQSSQREGETSSYTVNVTNYCPALKGTTLPVSLALHGHLAATPSHLAVTCALRADTQDLFLELSQSSSSPQLSGTLTHSLPGLRSRGVPQVITIQAAAPGTLFIKAGTCSIRSSRITESAVGGQWLWALESGCPILQARLNGSVSVDPRGIWTATVDSDLEGQRVFLRVRAKAWPELSLSCELSHSLPALKNLPEHSRVSVTARAGKQRYETEAVLQMEGCAVRGRGLVDSHAGLRGSLLYLNNCSVVQEWGSPDSVVSSGFLAVSPSLVECQVSVATDGTEIQTSAALKKNREVSEAWFSMSHSVPLLRKVGLPVQAGIRVNSANRGNGSYSYMLNCSAGSQQMYKEVSVTKMPETVRLRGRFQHAVNYLKKMGIPANNSIQAELGSAEEKALTLQSEFGGQQAGVRLMLKCLQVTKEIRGNMWHSWSWLRDRGLPHNTEFMCAMHGVLARLQSQAQVMVDGRSFLTSGLNISSSDGRLSLLLSVSPPTSNQTQPRLATTVSAQLKGPLRSAFADVHCHDWRVQMMGDIQGWGAYGGSKEARLTLRHTLQAHTNPALQVEAWGRLTDSQLRCSVAVNPELSTSLALILQGNHLPPSKDLMLKVVQNIPSLLLYLPPQLGVSSQLNQSRSAVAASVVVLSGRKRRLFAQGELAALDGGYRQAAEFRHSFPQVTALPRTVTVRTLCEARNWSYHVQHGAAWGSQKFTLSGLYSAPPTLDMGNQALRVQINSAPRRTSMEAVLERSLRGRLDSVSLSWMRHGQQEQVKVLSSWSHTDEMNERKLELRQPFTSTLSQLSLHTLSQEPQKRQFSSQQAHLSWKSAVPVNVSVVLNKQWHNRSSRGQACALFSTQQMEVSSLKGCFSVSQEGNSYTQHSELRWNNKSIKQGIKYQRAAEGMHNLQFSLGLEKVSAAPCPSHSFLVKIQTNFRDRLEHTAVFGLCPLQPALSWSGSHRVNIAEELFYSQTHLSMTGRPQLCSFVVMVTDSSTTHGSNMSLFSGSRVGNWSVEVGASVASWPRGSGLLLHASLDHREKIWVNGSLEGRCLRSTAGFRTGPDLDEDVTAVACVGTNGSLTLDVQEKVGGRSPETVGALSLGSANQRLTLRAKACLERLAAIEARIQDFGSQTGKKLLRRIKTLQDLILEFRRQHPDSPLLGDLASVGLRVAQRAEGLPGRLGGGLVPPLLRRGGPLRGFITETLPHLLGLLQRASLLGQQELRKPLATLAGVYQDVRGQKPEELWREAVSRWAGWLPEVLPDLLGRAQLRPLARAGIGAFSLVLEATGQHTYHWLESRLALALAGIRKRLASVYKLSPSECSVVLSLPLPWSQGSRAGLMEVLLEEWLLRPLQSLATIRPVAEFYRLKRKMMDSPFRHQALLLADQFAVTFDGHLRRLPDSCGLLLAQDVSADSSFTLLLNADAQSYILIGLNNDTVSIQKNGQVRVNCNDAVSHTFHGNSGLAVRVRSNFVQLSNQNGVSLSCDLLHKVCSFTLDGWLHGTSAGLLGTNDNEAGNDSPLPDGSQAEHPERLWQSWVVGQEGGACAQPPRVEKHFVEAATSPVRCSFLFSSPDSPLSSCFRVVDPGQFLSACELIVSAAPCTLAHAFVNLCQQNYIPLEVPAKCLGL